MSREDSPTTTTLELIPKIICERRRGMLTGVSSKTFLLHLPSLLQELLPQRSGRGRREELWSALPHSTVSVAEVGSGSAKPPATFHGE